MDPQARYAQLRTATAKRANPFLKPVVSDVKKTTTPKPTKKTVPHKVEKTTDCRYGNNCNNKDNCPYNHAGLVDKKAIKKTVQRKAEKTVETESGKKETTDCRYGVNCNNKDNCPYNHAGLVDKKIERSEMQCFHELHGGCKYRTQCSFLHSNVTVPNFLDIVAKFAKDLETLSLTDSTLNDVRKNCLDEIENFHKSNLPKTTIVPVASESESESEFASGESGSNADESSDSSE